MMRRPTADVLLIALVALDGLLILPALGGAESLRLFLFQHLGFVGLLSCLLGSINYAVNCNPAAPFRWRGLALTVSALLLLSLTLDLSGTSLIPDVLGILHRRFQAPYWQAAGLILTGLLFSPLAYAALRKALNERRHVDLAVCAGFLLLVCLLYVPFGFDSIGHWESWIFIAYLEGRFSWSVVYELPIRFWSMLTHYLSIFLSPNSFSGFHLSHLLILWGKMTLLYAIFRQLSLARLFAFLLACLAMLYPVNSDLLSLRSLNYQVGVLTLLTGLYLLLSYRNSSGRLHLLCIWLALILNVASNESAYALILMAPLLLLLLNRPTLSAALNLTAIWYLAPLAKLAHLLLLAGSSITFYNSYAFEGDWNPSGGGLTPVFERLMNVYSQAFVDGWLEAIAQLFQSNWLAMSAIVAALIAGFAWLLMRDSLRQPPPATRDLIMTFAAGLLLIVPSVGVLIWLEQYSGDLWRMYFYVPIGASIAVFSLFALATSPIKQLALRNSLIVALCLVAFIPGIARLYEQHEGLVSSADNKARLLHNLLKIVPSIEPDTVILLLTDMTREQLDETDFYEFGYSRELDDSMLYVLYDDRVSRTAHFCLESEPCSHLELVTDPLSPDWNEETYQRTLILKIQRDLTVEVIQDPKTYFDLDFDIAYDAGRLYDADAPLPPRATTMLGPALNR